jgi:hypothetical protein
MDDPQAVRDLAVRMKKLLNIIDQLAGFLAFEQDRLRNIQDPEIQDVLARAAVARADLHAARRTLHAVADALVVAAEARGATKFA